MRDLVQNVLAGLAARDLHGGGIIIEQESAAAAHRQLHALGDLQKRLKVAGRADAKVIEQSAGGILAKGSCPNARDSSKRLW